MDKMAAKTGKKHNAPSHTTWSEEGIKTVTTIYYNLFQSLLLKNCTVQILE